MSVTLRFREDGAAFERAKCVADALGLSMEEYLFACVAEGHKVLRARCAAARPELEEPAFIRRGYPAAPPWAGME
ncbi:hypothetical protein SAMN02982917_3063 [Azospirillum oryzae]|uniref:Uncharacterized protein n=1 Tax=Azospirillum oryzae TaxID=286727 RepID=A0A1X7FMZ1_9PROT|nr:hypothetical protein [Azospirillum oryzae]SMF55328.1 hypothetical protein SAMN02982917_3063 [Azospirillum oryzae]